MSTIEKKPGVYLCKGCGIADALSVDALEQMVASELKVATCRQIDACCSSEGLALIRADVDAGEVNQPVIAACSSRVMCEEFEQVGGQVIRANIREQVIWSQPSGDENTQMMAADYIRMAVASAAKMDTPEPYGESATSMKLLVVGGGVSGLNAAHEAAKTGADVVLVEKTGELGGWARKWTRHIPHDPPYRGDKAITVKTNTVVARTEGGPGDFKVQLQNGKGAEWDVFGAIVVATGWRPYDTADLEPLGYGVSPDIVTDIEFEALLSDGLKRKSDGKTPEIVAFVIPGGSERMPFSSGVSDRVAIKQALQVVETVPGAMVYVIYEDLRAHGMAEDFYREAQEAGVIFQKGEVKSVSADLTVTVKDDLLGEEAPMSGLDMVVLSTGMVPNSTDIDRDPVERGAALLEDDIDPRAPITISGQRVNGGDAAGNGAEPAETAADATGGEPALPGGTGSRIRILSASPMRPAGPASTPADPCAVP
jgi:quinone-modifying oxidoreductase subunit QmoB